MEEPAPPAFDESLAGADLALATIGWAWRPTTRSRRTTSRSGGSRLLQTRMREENTSSATSFLFLDPDTWQLRTPEDLERLRHQRGAEVVQEDDVDKLRASNAAQHDKIVLMRRAAAKAKRDHADEVAKTSEELSATRDALERATAALAARADDVAALEAELARLRAGARGAGVARQGAVARQAVAGAAPAQDGRRRPGVDAHAERWRARRAWFWVLSIDIHGKQADNGRCHRRPSPAFFTRPAGCGASSPLTEAARADAPM